MATEQEFLSPGEVVVRVSVPAEASSLGASLPDLLAEAGRHRIEDAEGAEIASRLIRTIKERYKILDERRKAMTKPLDEAKQQALDLFRPALDALRDAEDSLKHRFAAYMAEQESIAAERRRVAEEEARRERERLAREAAEVEMQARQTRQLAEDEARRARAEAERQVRLAEEAGLKSFAERMRAEAVSREAESLERAEVAALERQVEIESLMAQAEITVPAVVEAPALPHGLVSRESWSAEVFDMMELVKAVASGSQPLSLLEANMSILHRMARTLKGDLCVPGVRAVRQDVVVSRSR